MANNSRLFSFHLSSVLLAMLVVYVYRDVAPLFLRHGSPTDVSEGVYLWLKLLLLCEAALGVPLGMPRAYKPYNPSVRRSAQFLPRDMLMPTLIIAGTHGPTQQEPNGVRLVFDSVQLVERDGREGVSCSSPAAGGAPSACGHVRNSSLGQGELFGSYSNQPFRLRSADGLRSTSTRSNWARMSICSGGLCACTVSSNRQRLASSVYVMLTNTPRSGIHNLHRVGRDICECGLQVSFIPQMLIYYLLVDCIRRPPSCIAGPPCVSFLRSGHCG